MDLNDLSLDWQIFNNNLIQMNKYYNRLFQAKNIEEKVDIMIEQYNYVKEISYDYYSNEDTNLCFNEILKKLNSSEQFLSHESIINSKGIYNLKTPVLRYPKNKEIKEVLDYIVNQVRKYLFFKHNNCVNDGFALENVDLTGDCFKASRKVKSLCCSLGIRAWKIVIIPGFEKEAFLFNEGGQHAFCVVEVNDELFLVDCTYSQFFWLKDNLLERIGIMHYPGCKVGAFMMLKESRKKLAENLIKDGYVKLTPDVFKDYLDGFAISFRNGLYYEKTNDFSYETIYTPSNYYDFLFKEDSQLNYEDVKTLGYAQKPLSNPHLKF